MYSRPSSSVTRAPRPLRMKTGVPPTAPNARTGEFTPPGIRRVERSKRSRLRSYIVVSRGIEARERARCGGDVGRVEEGGNHGEHVGARGDHFLRVVEVDAADGR